MNNDDQARQGKARRPNIDAAFVRELAALLDETGLTEIEVEEAGTRVRIARQGTFLSAPMMAAPHGAGAPAPHEAKPEKKSGTEVTSPMVGTAYVGPSPGAPPFVKVGDTVKEGQTLIIIEAMKTMNQVPANVSGRVAEIFVQDGQPVEFGEPLMRIE